MDVDFWAARVHRHIPSAQSARLTSSGEFIFLPKFDSLAFCDFSSESVLSDFSDYIFFFFQ